MSGAAKDNLTWIEDADGLLVLPWMAFDGMKKTPARKLARRIVRAVNKAEGSRP
jgi:hypothetical protein